MAQYRIDSDRVDGFKVGDIVNDTDLPGVNIDALIDGGFISATKTSAAKQTDTAKES